MYVEFPSIEVAQAFVSLLDAGAMPPRLVDTFGRLGTSPELELFCAKAPFEALNMLKESCFREVLTHGRACPCPLPPPAAPPPAAHADAGAARPGVPDNPPPARH